ncbi:MAG: hypothetical protein ACKPKO_61680, partial [Candidatus Fonsibacter sp.]
RIHKLCQLVPASLQSYSGTEGLAYLGYLQDMHHRARNGSEILNHPNFIVPMLLAKFKPHRDALQ